MTHQQSTTTKKIGFALVSGAGDTYPAIRLAKLLQEASIDIEWVILGWKLPVLQDATNVTLLEIEDWDLYIEAAYPNASPEAKAYAASWGQRFDDAVYHASQHWDAVIISPAVIVCPVADRCKTIPLSFQNNFFTHPDTWVRNHPLYNDFCEPKQKVLESSFMSLLLWPEAIYAITPPPKEPHVYIGYPHVTASGKLPDALQAFLQNCRVQEMNCIYLTMGSTSVRTKQEWQSLLYTFTQHVAVVADCRHQDLTVEEALACKTQYPLYLVDQDINLEQLFSSMEWIVCHGGVGTVSMALFSEKPLLLMPGHVEQQWWCRKHVENGYARYLDITSLEQTGYVSGLLEGSTREKCAEKARAFKQRCSFDGVEKASQFIIEHI